MGFYYDEKNEAVRVDRIIFSFLFMIIALVMIFGSFTIVQVGHRGVLLTWGAYSGTLGEGLHFIIPVAQKVEMMAVQTQKYEADASAATQDLLDVSTKVALNYHISPDVAGSVFQKVGMDYENKVISPAVQEVVKSVTAKFAASDLITNRTSVKNQIDEALIKRLEAYDILVETTSITDFQFPAAFNQAILDSQVATKRTIEAENQLKVVQFQAQQAIAAAQGQANSTILNAEAAARSIEIRGTALRNNPGVTNLEAINKWDGKLPVNMFGGSSQVVPFINVPLTSSTTGA